MIYHDLADYYDDLVKDEEATMRWADLTESVLGKQRKKILELACGSAEISLELSLRGYSVLATDLSQDMLNKAKAKNDLLPFSIIAAATNGNVDAIYTVVKHYAGYIAALSVRLLYDENGMPVLCVDEEMRRRLETKLIARILTFRLIT